MAEPDESDPWLDRWLPLLKAQAASPRILELGCGEGRDTAYLLRHGLSDVTAVDIDSNALAACSRHAPGVSTVQHDLRNPLPFSGHAFDVVLASLCLHYFAWDLTEDIVREIRRCLAPDGLLLCRLNSTQDINHGAQGYPEIAPHFYQVDGQEKRFFDQEAVTALFKQGWACLLMEKLTIGRYALPKVVWEIALRKTDA